MTASTTLSSRRPFFPSLPGAAYAATNTAFDRVGGAFRTFSSVDCPEYHQYTACAFQSASATRSISILTSRLRPPTSGRSTSSAKLPERRSWTSPIGRRAYHLLGAYNVNQTQTNNGFLDAPTAGGDSPRGLQALAADTRRNPGETGSQMVRRLYTSQVNFRIPSWLAGAIAAARAILNPSPR